ncbi:hypothetical protein JHK82_018550 [Glycine max]|nr:hypothetical protein JHK82_018550 [Glycine max]
MLFAGWFYYHKVVPKLAWFQDVESMLNHHLTGFLGVGTASAAWNQRHDAIEHQTVDITKREKLNYCLLPTMADVKTEVTLKLVVIKGRNEVLFVEAGKDFVDALFSFLK